jgi:N-acetylglucosamine-6-sulfatase
MMSWLTMAWAVPVSLGRSSHHIRAAAPTKPNILVIQLDDQILSDLSARYLANPGIGRPTWWARLRWNWWDPSPHRHRWKPVLPNIQKLLIDQGVSFARYYASEPLCCPSRAALLTGRYAHNNSVENNGGRHRGFEAFKRHDYHSNVAVWLERAGYDTIHVGKFLNGYESQPPTPPPGWRDWQTLASDSSDAHYYGYTINSNGKISRPYGDSTYKHRDPRSCRGRPSHSCKYVTDVLTQKAVQALGAVPRRQPFYLQIDYTAPHVDKHGPFGPEPPTRYSGGLPGVRAPRVPGFNEANMSDKPAFLRGAPRLSKQQIAGITQTRKLRLESERAVDDGVGRLIERLARLGRLNNTYVLLTSDNGWFQGEHRLAQGKFLAYEPSTHLPLLIRGPGIPKGHVSQQLAANVDLTPTFLQIAHARASRSFDGRGLLEFAKHPQRNLQRAILLESFTRGMSLQPQRGPGGAPPAAYEGIRVGPYKYIKYAFGPTELYNLVSDPFELRSLAQDPRYRNVRLWLSAHLKRLEKCKGASCRMKIGTIPQPARASGPR